MSGVESLGPLARAAAAHRAGNFEEARHHYDTVVANVPDHVTALHLLGLLEHQQGRYQEAIRFFDLVLFIARDNAGALNSRGIALAALERHGEALWCYDQALTIAPDNVDATNNRGITLGTLGRQREALNSFDRALALTFDNPTTHYNRGKALSALEQHAEALASYDNVLTLSPAFAEALNNRGLVLCALDRQVEAVENYERALAIALGHADAHNNRGNALRTLFRPHQSLESYDAALIINPADGKVWHNRGHALRDLGRRADARHSYDRALILAPGDTVAIASYADALRALSHFDEALASCDQALVLSPDYADALHRRANLLREVGRLDEARDACQKTVALAPRRIEYHCTLAELTRVEPRDPILSALERLAEKIEEMSADEQCKLHFALGKAYDDVGQRERSFNHLIAGNALRRRQVPYDEDMVIGFSRRVSTAFTPELMLSRRGHGYSSDLPIFIVGMPRSGTTLVEQILASHPNVRGAGELPDLGQVVGDASDAISMPFPEIMGKIGDTELSQIGAGYVARLAALAPGADRVVDKMMSNFHFIGLIHLALPNARIIHMRRDPMDTCLSCFAKNFSAGQLFSFDLGELGRYYRSYQCLMEHWRRLLLCGAMLEVHYEDVVADVEGQTRRILDYCGLAWSAACLEFYRTAAPVRTASAIQVRQPIYRSSVGRWRPSATLLRTLTEALGGVVE